MEEQVVVMVVGAVKEEREGDNESEKGDRRWYKEGGAVKKEPDHENEDKKEGEKCTREAPHRWPRGGWKQGGGGWNQ